MRVGVAIGHSGESARQTVANASRAEAAGFDIVGVADSQVSQREVYGVLAAIASGTERITLGPLVTNPVTRHPLVTASAIATVDEISSGRAFLAIGHGRSAVLQAGLRPATSETYRTAIEAIRRGVTWSTRSVPIIVHANGPQSSLIAAELGDGVLLRWGDRSLEAMLECIASVRAAHSMSASAARPLDIWVYVNAFVGDPIIGRKGLRAIVSSRASGLAPDDVPDNLRQAMSTYRNNYKVVQSSSTSLANYELLSKLALEDFMFARFALIGDADEVSKWLASMRDIGVDVVIFGISQPDSNRLIDSMLLPSRLSRDEDAGRD